MARQPFRVGTNVAGKELAAHPSRRIWAGRVYIYYVEKGLGARCLYRYAR